MACYKPLVAYQNIISGAVAFHNEKRYGDTKQILLPCGRCTGCKLQRANDWATRCGHEASLHEHNAYITLTWNEKKLETQTLCHDDWQRFAKRLRKALTSIRYANTINISESLYTILAEDGHTALGLRPIPQLKYYMAGEYGTKGRRPHFHACLFGIDFADKKKHSTNLYNDILYTSATLDKIWGNGFTTIGKVTYESAAYIARYILDKKTGDEAAKHYEYVDQNTGEITQLKPEYNRMSLAEGIGKQWLNKYMSDVYKDNNTGAVITRGKPNKAPKYYDKIYKKKARNKYDEMKERREYEAYKQQGDNTDDRLATKEKVKQAQLNQIQRKLL